MHAAYDPVHHNLSIFVAGSGQKHPELICSHSGKGISGAKRFLEGRFHLLHIDRTLFLICLLTVESENRQLRIDLLPLHTAYLQADNLTERAIVAAERPRLLIALEQEIPDLIILHIFTV